MPEPQVADDNAAALHRGPDGWEWAAGTLFEMLGLNPGLGGLVNVKVRVSVGAQPDFGGTVFF